ncbi:MAG: transcriptional repressor [Hyphomonas sp.]|nr:transcriptional repressor [Hyphomonas sp.]
MSDFDAASFLDRLGLRATRPRLRIARILFADRQDRHVTAEWLADELARQQHPVALATVYNTLHALTEAGALREVRGASPGTIVFDTHTGPHHHFYDETTGELTDIPADAITLQDLPQAPDGKTISGCDIVIRLR